MTATHPRRQVLYVEDEPINVLLMEALFRHRPALDLVVATSCAEACAIAPALHPDLLLLDIRLPDGSGHELLPRLRQQPGWHRIGAVAVTAEPDVRAEATAFDEVWPKPLDLSLVLRRLDKWLPPEPALDAVALRSPRRQAKSIAARRQPSPPA